MDWIRKIMLGCKQHYEKIILSVILLGLAATVWYLNGERNREQEKIAEFLKEINKRGNKETKRVDFTEYDDALRRAQKPPELNFALPHNLLNPVRWQRRPNGELIKVQTGDEVGWPQMAISQIRPLKLTIAIKTAPNSNYCSLAFSRDSAPRGYNNQTKFFTLNSSNRFMEMPVMLKELKGAPDNPQAILENMETGERISISQDKPFETVEGYEADLKYTVNGQSFPNLRVGSSVKFLGDNYNIVAISSSEVVASGSNNRKYPVRRLVAP